MSKQPARLLATAVGIITTQAVVATLIALKLITADSASAQPREDQGSPTLQRLRQLHQVEEGRKAAEDAKWRSFRINDVKSAGSMIFDALTNRPPKCEFYWPGWTERKDGVRITDARNCGWDKVAVNCNSLKVSWYKRPLSRHSQQTAYWSPWSIPGNSYGFEQEASLMVASLCDNTALLPGQEKQSQPLTPAKPVITTTLLSAEARNTLPMPSDSSVSFINVGAEGKKILNTLGEMGILIEVRDKCPKARAVGAYSRFDNLLVLCTASIRNPALATEAIAHEAIHALQDCVQPGGIKGSDSITITRFLKTFRNGKYSADFRDQIRMGLKNRPKILAYLQELKIGLPRNLYLMEIEAHALEVSPRAVITLLETFELLCRVPA